MNPQLNYTQAYSLLQKVKRSMYSDSHTLTSQVKSPFSDSSTLEGLSSTSECHRDKSKIFPCAPESRLPLAFYRLCLASPI